MLRNPLLLSSVGLVLACTPTGSLEDGAVTTAKLADQAVTSAKLASGSVEARAIGAGAVTSEKLADSAVTSTTLASGAVDARALAGGAVGTQQLGLHAVTDAALSDGAVQTRAIAQGAVGTAQLGPGAVTAAKLDPSAAVLGLNGMTGAVSLAGGEHLSVQTAGNTVTLGLVGPFDADTLGGVAPAGLLQLSGNQTVTGSPTFAAAGAPFAVSSSELVTNLNAERVGGVRATAFARRLHNVLTVGPDGEDFATIQAAINSITDASSTNRYLIQVAPGLYPEFVVMQSFVDVRGAGERLTTIAPPSTAGAIQSVWLADDTTLEGLSVHSTGPDLPRAIYLAAGSAALRNVQLAVSGSSNCVAVRLETGGTLSLERVVASSPGNDGVILSNNSGPVIVRDSRILGGSKAIYVGGPVSVANSEVNGPIYAGSVSCVGAYRSNFTALNASCQ